MRFGVLGPLAAWDADGEPIRVREAKVRALLADLLVHEGRPVSADRLVDDLWGDEPPGNPANALQAKVSQLRRALGRDRVLFRPGGYLLRLDDAEVDARLFHSLVSEARLLEDPAARAEHLTRALALWRGPAYADFADEEFARAAVHRLTEQRLAVLEEQAEARLEAGELTLLTGELADLVTRYPLRERLRAVHMRALYLAGRQSEALASFADLRDRLADELGLDPGPALTALHEAILRQDESLTPPHRAPAAGHVAAGAAPSALPAPDPVRPQADAADAVRPEVTSPRADAVRPQAGEPGKEAAAGGSGGGRGRSNLPVALSGLVGRERAVGEVRESLRRARIVTLAGPGGVGKTRLAMEAASRMAGEGFPDGVWLVELAGQRGGIDELAQVVAAVLGIREDAPSGVSGLAAPVPPAERLSAALRDRRALLVLDNCEHVIEAAAELAERVLRAAPEVRVLATSQEPLCLEGETVFPVEPLPPADAVRLFAERAAAAAPGFSLDDDREAVEEICRRLDGIPLALELAATRMRTLGARELAARLGDRFRVLTAGRRGAPARQQTLRAMIDWSWELLSAPERIVLRRLAVHDDGCSLDAAEAVCAGDGVAREEVLDLVTRLVDRSLVVMVDGPAGPRYRLLESVAAYAMERLHEMEDLAGVRDRHLRYYLDLAERAEPHLRDGGQRAWLARLDADSANLRSALDEALRRADPGHAVRLASALSWWWLLRGRLTEARRALAAVLGIVPDAAELRVLHNAFALITGDRTTTGDCPQDGIADPLRRGRAVWLYAYGLFSAGDPAGSEEINARALDLFAGDAWGTAAALALRATQALVRGDLRTVERDGPRAAELFRELGDRWGELQTVQPLAARAEILGDYEEAERRHHDGLRIARELGLETEVSARLSGLGRLALLARDWDRASDLHERARRLAVEQGYVYGEVHAVMGLALGARRSGDLDAAERHLAHIRDHYAAISSPAGDHLRHAELGFIHELRGDRDGAAAHHLLSLRVARAIAEPRALALSLEGLAGAAALAGPETLAGSRSGAELAALLLGAADAARRGVGAPLPPGERRDVDRVTAAATAVLGSDSFAASFREGAALPAAEAADLAEAYLSPGERLPEDLP
ncbi:AfsR/SARP family transcriptional regulator [Bailinhaonella thermotolerans]|uniref:AfsR/SARP family transcriptional regulator n=1 Tax=Bailinhaonella thermotolerans TaxID=1070861 RepID=A0A3A4ATZ5_9ACTN|nr:BTAD domain-containing putative transcriptional regulator [Bailinhaonella thermotolerans]RJL32089.1 AfsR/SARP family transcriptional regulator [Bailinhaonella thermotolerans]